MEHFDFLVTVFLGLGFFLISLVTSIHILLNKHEEPVSAVLWVFVVFSFPIVGLIFYLIFGINRRHTQGIRIKTAHEFVNAGKIEPAHKPLISYLEEQRRFIAKVDSPDFHMLDRLLSSTVPLTGNKVELLCDGTKAYPRMLKEIEKAKNSVNLQSYIIMDDPIGKKIFDLLEQKAREGVNVKVIYDRFGSWPAFLSLFFTKFGKNIPNLKIRPFAPFNLKAPWSIQLRNHRKLIVIDGQVAFVGGINISGDNDSRLNRKDRYIHDLHCFIKGPAVGEFQFSFLRDWHYVTSTPLDQLFKEDYFPSFKECGDSIVRVVASGPGGEEDYEASEKVFMTAVSTAKQYIWIMTPYFIPDKPFWRFLCMAVAKGVEVRIIIPQKNNHWYIHYATQSLYRPLLEAGIRIYEKRGSFSHAKAMLVDGVWAYMGSSNCDVRSFRLNYELDFTITKGVFLDQLHSQFMKEMEDSKEICLEDILNKKIALQLLENACSLFTPVL